MDHEDMPVMPEVLAAKMPPGSHAAISTFCAKHKISSSEFVRFAVRQTLKTAGIPTTELDRRTVRLPALVPDDE